MDKGQDKKRDMLLKKCMGGDSMAREEGNYRMKIRIRLLGLVGGRRWDPGSALREEL